MLKDILPVFWQMLVLFLILGLGYVGGKTNVMTIDGNKGLSKLVNCITNPCGILYSALCVEHVFSNGEVLKLIVYAVVMYLGLILIAQVIPKLLRVKIDQVGQFKFMMIFSNIGYMGKPVVNAVFGPEAEFCVSIFIMVFYIYLYSYGIVLITGDGDKEGFQWKRLLTPMMVCSVVGIVCYLCNVQFGGVIANTLSTVSHITTPCAMLIIGCALSALPMKTVFSNWRLYVVALLKLLVVPTIAYLCLRPLIHNSMLLGVIVVIMAMPIASNFTMLSAQYDRDQKLAASAVFITTLMSVLTIPILAGILKA